MFERRFASRRTTRLWSALLLGALLGVSALCGAPVPADRNAPVPPASEKYSRLGPYPVGVRTVVLVDGSRQDEYAGGPRTLVTDIWYPAVEESRDSRPTTFLEFFGKHQDAARAFVEHFGGDMAEVNRRFKTIAVRDAGLRQGTYPLLIFSHGNGGVRHQNVFQLDHLASHGYVIATPDHTGNAGITPLADRALPYDRKGRSQSAIDRPLDVSFLITRLLAEGSREESWLQGAIDGDKIGVLGHSFGGYTACKVVDDDPRVKAILPMTVVYGKRTSVPLLLMLAGRDRTVKEATNRISRLYYMACNGPRHLLELKRGGHFTFSDMDRINPDFGDGIGRDRKSGEEFYPIGLAKKVINRFSLAFFDLYLKGEENAAAILADNPDPDEIELRSDGPAAAPPAPGAAPGQAEKTKARLLIVTGDDVPAHDWRATTPQTREILESDGRFEVFVTEDPGLLESSTLERYDAVVLNYRNPPARDPGSRARENLAAFVRRGKGLVILHFGVFAFPGWAEYPKLAGRVWVGRRSGEKVSGHPPRGPFAVRVEAKDHPITRGMSDFEADDELYSKLVGDVPIDVLLSAHSGYSQRREPIAWTRTYGEGRVFVTVLGHDVEARENPAFKRLLLGGSAWAAGRVTRDDG